MTTLARRAPRARLYSRVPRSSELPSISTCWYCVYWLSQAAWRSSVAVAVGVSEDESVSKKMRSPTVTRNSCWLPGGPPLGPRLPTPVVGLRARGEKNDESDQC